jgi:hypothetical protein
MDVVSRFIPPDGAHISIKAFIGMEAVLFQGVAFPFGQGLDDLAIAALLFQDIKGNRTFDTVQVIIETGFGINEQGRRYSEQIETLRQQRLEEILDDLDGFLGLVEIQGGFIMSRDINVIHIVLSASVTRSREAAVRRVPGQTPFLMMR